MNIILVGFMGSGKTTIARILSRRLKLRFVDTDKLIEKQEKSSIKDIFETKGEGYFRELEKRIIESQLKFCNDCVIATGGGMPCFFDNMKRLKNIGWVVFLDVPFESILERVRNSKKRPLLFDEEKARELFNKRIRCYSKAHFTVEAKEKELTAEKIEDLILRSC